jgi:hypothetical protein
VRWFFEGPVRRNFDLKHWFETLSLEGIALDAPEWQGRLGDEPDRYLLLPRADDLGIKWREGQFQAKGRAGDLGVQQFGGGHAGRVERWIKWSYAKVPHAYEELFRGAVSELPIVAVGKTRALHKFRLDTFSGSLRAVPAESPVDRGLGMELTEIEVQGNAWTSLGFEAFPDDPAMPGHFSAAVDTLLAGLTDVRLTAEASFSYPAWLWREGLSRG